MLEIFVRAHLGSSFVSIRRTILQLLEYYLDLSVATRLVGQSRSIEINQGAPMSLPCKFLGLENASSYNNIGNANGERLSSSDSLAVVWTFNGKRVGFDGNVYMKPGQSDLIFFGARKSDQGNYTCQLRNGNKNSNNINNGKGKSTKTSSKKVINGMDLSYATQQQLTYRLHVKGIDLSLHLLKTDELDGWLYTKQDDSKRI
jgi:hypothetical protein